MTSASDIISELFFLIENDFLEERDKFINLAQSIFIFDVMKDEMTNEQIGNYYNLFINNWGYDHEGFLIFKLSVQDYILSAMN